MVDTVIHLALSRLAAAFLYGFGSFRMLVRASEADGSY